MANTTWVGSPNYTAGRGGYSVLGCVIHWMDGNLAGADGVFQDTNRNTSAHYGVEDNTVHQYVKEEDTAYQAGNWVVNEQTIGIEHSAQPGRDATDATYASSAQLIADAAKRWGFAINGSTVRPHNSIISTQCPGTVDVNRLINAANSLTGNASAPAPAQPPAPAPSSNVAGTATVTVPLLYVRAEPNHNSALAGSQQLTQGQTFDYSELVQGEDVSGISTWLHSTLGHYVWAGGTDINGSPATTPPVSSGGGGTAEAVNAANVRVAPNTSAPLGGSQVLQPGQTFGYSAKVNGQNVSENGVTTDVWYHSNVGNFVWSGNVKDV